MKAVNPHRDCLEAFFEIVPFGIIELIAQIMSKEGSQVATSIDQKLSVRNVVFLGEMIDCAELCNSAR